MCYCNCEYEKFNPLTGECKCTFKGKIAPCEIDSEYLITCPYCDTNFVVESTADYSCPNCNLTCLN